MSPALSWSMVADLLDRTETELRQEFALELAARRHEWEAELVERGLELLTDRSWAIYQRFGGSQLDRTDWARLLVEWAA